MTAANVQIKELLRKISAAVQLKDVAQITGKIKNDLEELIKSGKVELPEELKAPQKDGYARRLVHQDKKSGFVIVAMTWGPGQGTLIHDHAGIWCVEGVIEGKMSVTSYNITDQKGDLYKFEETDCVTAGVGGAGALIPPYEHHILKNILPDQSSVTVHVYGGEMSQCACFIDQNDGWYRKETKNLMYT